MFAVLQACGSTALPGPRPGDGRGARRSLLSALFDFEARGIAVVGDVPTGLPELDLAAPRRPAVDTILLGAAAIFLVSFGAGIVTARSFGAAAAMRSTPNRELTGFGAANIAAGLFGAFPVTASNSRTAVNMTVGGRSQVAGLVAAATPGRDAAVSRRRAAHPADPGARRHPCGGGAQPDRPRRASQIWRISPIEFVFALIALWGRSASAC